VLFGGNLFPLVIALKYYFKATRYYLSSLGKRIFAPFIILKVFSPFALRLRV